ncbi:hypothetical protein CBR_g39471 [Chara braunii]|uniref:Right handed beta helix domain-containing protein n=1 Tax=Chara braunii TaxID=69332 RepID=A0A388LRS0_CHABU|nr:hypothetical protein CBR_g39471 [Chara braunii]|eukprot:GBG85007.1 hypothetical protein CBR_g39471 [Chara braunii]
MGKGVGGALRTLVGVILLLGCLLEYSAPGCAALGGSAQAAATTPEACLRSAVTRKKKTVLQLTADVVLSADLPVLKCPDLVIVGKCKTPKGRPRKCKIDGANKFKGFQFLGQEANLTLSNVELTRFSLLVYAAASGDVVITDCVLTDLRASASSRGVVAVENVGLTVRNSLITRSKGTILVAGYGGLDMANVIFRGNSGGPVLDHYRAGLRCDKCGFESNTASGDHAVVEPNYGVATFSRSWFVGNSRTKVGARGGAVYVGGGMTPTYFCNCRFANNTILLAGGRKKVEHVYVAKGNAVEFCPKRPSTGLGVASGASVKDSCGNC